MNVQIMVGKRYSAGAKRETEKVKNEKIREECGGGGKEPCNVQVAS